MAYAQIELPGGLLLEGHTSRNGTTWLLDDGSDLIDLNELIVALGLKRDLIRRRAAKYARGEAGCEDLIAPIAKRRPRGPSKPRHRPNSGEWAPTITPLPEAPWAALTAYIGGL